MPRTLSRFWLWRLPAAAGLLLALFFATGFWLALGGSLGDSVGGAPPSPSSPSPAKAVSGAPRFLLALGDSLARGTGDETGKGFAGDLAETLRRRGRVTVANLAVNGWESSDVRGLLDSANARSLASRADWIVLSAGGNDLSHAVPREGANEGPVFYSCDIVLIRTGVEAPWPELLIQARERPRVHEPFAELVILFLGAVYPVDCGGPGQACHLLHPAEQVLILAERL